jgi:hypothetical protein
MLAPARLLQQPSNQVDTDWSVARKSGRVRFTEEEPVQFRFCIAVRDCSLVSVSSGTHCTQCSDQDLHVKTRQTLIRTDDLFIVRSLVAQYCIVGRIVIGRNCPLAAVKMRK